MSRHKTKSLVHNGRIIEIDEEIGDLIELLWKMGIETSSSCQSEYEVLYGNKSLIGKIYIQFKNHNSAVKFMNIVADYTDPLDKEQADFYDDVMGYDNTFIYHMNFFDKNHPIMEFPYDHCSNDLLKYQRPFPNVNLNVNMFFDPKYKNKVMEKLQYYLDNPPDMSKDRLDYEEPVPLGPAPPHPPQRIS